MRRSRGSHGLQLASRLVRTPSITSVAPCLLHTAAMLARVRSGALVGVEAVLVDVEVDMALGLPFFSVVGLPEGAAKESKVRVISALKNAGFVLPQKRVTVNLAPADLRKDGATFELPIALGVLAASGFLPLDSVAKYLFGGELSLDGALKPVRGVLPLAMAARDKGFRGVMVPKANAEEASLVDRIEVLAVESLAEAARHLLGESPLAPRPHQAGAYAVKPSQLDMSDVRGQAEVKDAMELAAAGNHNVLLCGPPGSGKTMVARRLPTIMPPMPFDEALEVTKVYSVLGLLAQGNGLMHERPFRSPHHTISDAGLVGGGPHARPGELSMAHRGVLFLDELPEFRRNVLEVLRQPLEEGLVRLARAQINVVYPCQTMLVAAMNPCPCGYYNVAGRICSCPKTKVADYFSRISGPLLDRLDVTLETRAVDVAALSAAEVKELPSSVYRERVLEARARQSRRFVDFPDVRCNAQMGPKLLRQLCAATPAALKQLAQAVKTLGFTARAHDRVLKMARTRADLEGHSQVGEEEMAFAIGCRVIDRRSWFA
jgi:magnesium chelatase family protein